MQIKIGSLIRIKHDLYHNKTYYKAGEIGVVDVVDHYRMYCDATFIGHLHDWGFDTKDVEAVDPGEENVLAYYRHKDR